MARTKIEFTKTYASEANAEKAVAKVPHLLECRYDILPVLVEGKVRYGVLFIGQAAIEAGAHWHFNVVA